MWYLISAHRSVAAKNNWTPYLDSFIRHRGLLLDHFTTGTSFQICMWTKPSCCLDRTAVNSDTWTQVNKYGNTIIGCYINCSVLRVKSLMRN
jgi:hypothetical protein